jgi:hypothetical protein
MLHLVPPSSAPSSMSSSILGAVVHVIFRAGVARRVHPTEPLLCELERVRRNNGFCHSIFLLNKLVHDFFISVYIIFYE